MRFPRLGFWRWPFGVGLFALGSFLWFLAVCAGLQRWAFCVELLAAVGLLALRVWADGQKAFSAGLLTSGF